MAIPYIMEPFRIKMVEPIKATTREYRMACLQNANYNMFSIHSEDVYIDMQTDSGTGANSAAQYAAMMTADESYGGARGYYSVLKAVQELFGFQYAQPVHQGRAAEKVLFPCLLGPGKYAIANHFFDTTNGHVVMTGARAINLVCEESKHADIPAPFKGNIDLTALEATIREKGAENIGMILMTITNNSVGGQPVSMENLRATSEIAHRNHIPFVIDAARYAENAYFIKTREKGYADKPVREIVKEEFSYADAFTMSAKKDAIASMGGIIGVREDEALIEAVRLRTIPNEGFLTYGGLSGRDIAAMAVGLYEGLDDDFLAYRIGQTQYLGEKLHERGVPLQYPVGGNAIYLDSAAIMKHIPWYQFPAQALSVALYLEGGIRGGDIGSLSLDRDPDTHEQLRADIEFCRLCLARRVYTQAHLDYVADIILYCSERAENYPGFRITKEAPVLRHFTARLEPLQPLK